MLWHSRFRLRSLRAYLGIGFPSLGARTARRRAFHAWQPWDFRALAGAHFAPASSARWQVPRALPSLWHSCFLRARHACLAIAFPSLSARTAQRRAFRAWGFCALGLASRRGPRIALALGRVVA